MFEGKMGFLLCDLSKIKKIHKKKMVRRCERERERDSRREKLKIEDLLPKHDRFSFYTILN